MISSKDISALQRLKCSVDIFFLLGILETNSVLVAVEVGAEFHNFFLQI